MRMIKEVESKIKRNKENRNSLNEEQIRYKIRRVDDIPNLCGLIIKQNSIDKLNIFLKIIKEELKENIILLDLMKKKEIINTILIEASLDLNTFMIVYEIITDYKLYDTSLNIDFYLKNDLLNLVLIYICINTYEFNKPFMTEIKKHLEDYIYFTNKGNVNNINREIYDEKIKRLKTIMQNTDKRFTLICFEIFLKVFENAFYLNDLYILIMNLPKSNSQIHFREIFKNCFFYLDDIEFMISVDSKIYNATSNNLIYKLKYKNVYALLNKHTDKIDNEIFGRIEINNLIIPNEYFNKMKEMKFCFIHLFQIQKSDKFMLSLCFERSQNFICKVCNKIIFPCFIHKENEININNIYHVLKHKHMNLENKEDLLISYYLNKGTEIKEFFSEISFTEEKTTTILLGKLSYYFKELKDNKKKGIIKFLELIFDKKNIKIELILSKIILENFSLFDEIEINAMSKYFCKLNKEKIITQNFTVILKNTKDCFIKESIDDTLLTNNTFSYSSNIKIFKYEDLERIVVPFLRLFNYKTLEKMLNDFGDILVYKLLKYNMQLCKKFQKYLSKGIAELLIKSPQSFNTLDIVYKDHFKRNTIDIFVNILQNEGVNEEILNFIMPDYKNEIEGLIVPLLFHLKNNYNPNKCIFKAIEFLIKEIRITEKNSVYVCYSVIYFLELTECSCKRHLINGNTCIQILLGKLLKQENSIEIVKHIIPYLKYEDIMKLTISTSKKIDLLNYSRYPVALNNSIRIILKIYINEFFGACNTQNNFTQIANLPINNQVYTEDNSNLISSGNLPNITNFYLFLSKKGLIRKETNHLSFLLQNPKTELKDPIGINTSFSVLIYENSLRDIAYGLLNCNNMEIMDKIFYALQEISMVLDEFSLFNNLDFVVDLPEVKTVCLNLCCSQSYLLNTPNAKINQSEKMLLESISKEYDQKNLFITPNDISKDTKLLNKIEGFKYELKNKSGIFINEFYKDIYNFVWCKLNSSNSKYDKLFLGSIFDREIRNTFLFPMVYFLMEYDSSLKEFIKLYFNLNCSKCILAYKGDGKEELMQSKNIFYGFFHKHLEIENMPLDLFLFLSELNDITNKEVVSYYDLLVLSIHFKYWEHALKCLYLIDCKKDQVYYSYLILVYYFLNEFDFIENIIQYFEVPNLLLFLENQRIGITRKEYVNKDELVYLGRFESFDRFSLYIKRIYRKFSKLEPFVNPCISGMSEVGKNNDYVTIDEINHGYNKLEDIYTQIIKNVPEINKFLIKISKKAFKYEDEVLYFINQIALIFILKTDDTLWNFLQLQIENRIQFLKETNFIQIELLLKWHIKFQNILRKKQPVLFNKTHYRFLQYELIKILVNLKKPSEANNLINKLISEGEYDAFYLKTKLFNEKEEKLKILKNCEKFKPTTFYNDFYILQGKLRNTLLGYQNVLENIKGNSDIYYLMAKYYKQKGDFYNEFLYYKLCIKDSNKYLKEVFPQLLFIYCEGRITANKIESKTDVSNNNVNISDILNYTKLEDLICFYNQIICRISNESNQVGNEIINILIPLINKYPIKTMWNSILYVNSTNKIVKTRMNEILSKIENKELFNKILELSKLFKKIAKYPLKSINTFSLKNKFPQIENYKNVEILIGNKTVKINQWLDEVKIYNSLKRPKRVSFLDENNIKYNLLCKNDDNLRRDQKSMEFFNLFNLLSKDLKIRTYGVIPFDSSSGIIEMVENIGTLRYLMDYKSEELEFIKGLVKKSQNLLDFLPEILEKVKPKLNIWFFKNFKDPVSWFNAHKNFIKSYAVMCGVGWFLGLGDRHCENITIDINTGETIHVDINMIFGKGLNLPIPEKVPFRLTQNIIDAFGPFGVNSLFKETLNKTINILKNNKELILNNMLGFVFDPLFVLKNANSIFDKLKEKLEMEDVTEELITASVDLKNLGGMFIGWAAYL